MYKARVINATHSWICVARAAPFHSLLNSFEVPTPKAAQYILQGMLITRTLERDVRRLRAEVFCPVVRTSDSVMIKVKC